MYCVTNPPSVKRADLYRIAGIGPKTRERLANAGIITMDSAVILVRRDGVCELLRIMDIGPKRSRRVLRRTGLEICPRCTTWISSPQLESTYDAIIDDRECPFLRRYEARTNSSMDWAEEPPTQMAISHGSAWHSAKSFLLGIGKDALVLSLLAGLTAIHPPAGAIAAKTYAFYSHSMAGLDLYNIYTRWKSGGLSAPRAAGEATKVISGEAMGGATNTLASSLVGGLGQTGTIDRLSKETNVNSGVITDMLKGTLSSSASEGFSDLEGYTVEKEAGT